MVNQQTISDMFEVKTANYRPPPTSNFNIWTQAGLPIFTIYQIERMRHDSQIKLGMAIKTAPLLKPQIEIEGDPLVKKFVEETFKAFWVNAIPKVLSALWYTRSAGEIVYRRDEKDGLVKFHRYKQVYPSDATVLIQAGRKFGIKVKVRDRKKTSGGTVQLIGPKSFLYVHRREFGSWDGISEFEGAYEPWMEKTDTQGAKASRKLWHFKCGFHGGFLFHPPGDYTFTDSSGNEEKIPNRDLAREALEKSMSGSVFTFPMVIDDNGNRLWEYTQPQMNGSGQDLLEYIKQLDTEILRGLEIPDDIVSQVGGTGSFAGRTIPLMSFFTSQTTTLQQIVSEFKEQILDYLVLINFKSLDYEITKVAINTDEMMPETPSQENKAGKTSKGENLVPEVNPEQPGQGNGKIPQFNRQPRIPVVK